MSEKTFITWEEVLSASISALRLNVHKVAPFHEENDSVVTVKSEYCCEKITDGAMINYHFFVLVS